MPGASLRKTSSAAHGFLQENNNFQQVLLRRALSSRRTPYDVTNGDGNFHDLRGTDESLHMSNTANNLKRRSGSVKLRKSRDRSIPRPASLDLSTINRIIPPPKHEEIKIALPDQIPGIVLPKRNHLSLFVPEAAHRAGSLRQRKGRRKRALRRSLVRSATIVGETIKAPIGDYLKESWDAFLTKITERQSELRKFILNVML